MSNSSDEAERLTSLWGACDVCGAPRTSAIVPTADGKKPHAVGLQCSVEPSHGPDITTLTLADFLLARIAEDEAWVTRSDCECGDQWPQLPSCPDRVLADCEAKRRIVERLSRVIGNEPPTSTLDEDGWELLAWETLFALASVYASHPDHREEWTA